MSVKLLVDPEALREQVRDKYREVAVDPERTFHFHTGRGLAARLGYDPAAVEALPERAVESFAGVANPFSLRPLHPGERVVDVGSGAGFEVRIGPPADTFGGASGERNARAYEVYGYAFLARRTRRRGDPNIQAREGECHA